MGEGAAGGRRARRLGHVDLAGAGALGLGDNRGVGQYPDAAHFGRARHPPGLPNFANDAAAATGGVRVGGMYRNGSALMVRVS